MGGMTGGGVMGGMGGMTGGGVMGGTGGMGGIGGLGDASAPGAAPADLFSGGGQPQQAPPAQPQHHAAFDQFGL